MKRIKGALLNLVFLGCGFAAKLHSKNLRRFKKEVRPYYASRDIAKAMSYNKKFSGSGYFESYDAAIGEENIDIVFITTPPSEHFKLALKALNAGKHVIVEKPPFLHSSDFEIIRKAQEKTKRRVLVAENYFYKPSAFKLREIIGASPIGEILFIHINALKMQKTTGWRNNLDLSGGGALFEGGIHWIDFIANLGFKIKNVRGAYPGKFHGLEKSVIVYIEFEEGPIGTLYYSWEIPSLFKGLRLSRIYGKEGSITFESNGIFIFVKGEKNRIYFPGLSDISGYKAMIKDFIQVLRGAKEPQFTLDLAHQDVRLIESIYSSMKKH